MPTFNNVNIKELNQVEEIVNGDYLITETENGTNIIDFFERHKLLRKTFFIKSVDLIFFGIVCVFQSNS